MTPTTPKPIIVEGIRFTSSASAEKIFKWSGGIIKETTLNVLEIKTLEGTMKAHIGDWIIKGVNGEFYQCKADIFERPMRR